MTLWFEIEVMSEDWAFIIERLLEKCSSRVADIPVAVVETKDGMLYRISSEFLPIADLAAALGIDASAIIEAEGRITLEPMGVFGDWESPTVEYFGEA